MKLFRFIQNGHIKTGLSVDNVFYDTSSFAEDYDEKFFTTFGMRRLDDFYKSQKTSLPVLNEADINYSTPFGRPSKIICIGLNYADHARETGATPPPEPVIFMKATTAITGPNDQVIIPKNSEKTDWEVELAVVIGRQAKYVDEDAALDYVAGYCLHNDVSERAFQLERSGTWDKGKGCDSFAPLGPWLVTPDEIDDVDNLRLWLKLNGQLMQDGNTSNLIFKIPFVIAYCSQFMTLLPGDIISTGTPAGVGMGCKPQVYLKPGDQMELGIDGLGVQRQTVKDFGMG